MLRSTSICAIFLGVALLLTAAPQASANGISCYYCECATCIPYLGGFNCDYVLQNKACDCALSGGCSYNPTYCSDCDEYPWAHSCQVISCAADPSQQACRGTDLTVVEIVQEEDASSWRSALLAPPPLESSAPSGY